MQPHLRSRHRLVAALCLVSSVVACSRTSDTAEVAQAGEAPVPRNALFTKLPSSETGVRFENRLEDIRYCTRCLQVCHGKMHEMSCVYNPFTKRELEWGERKPAA